MVIVALIAAVSPLFLQSKNKTKQKQNKTKQKRKWNHCPFNSALHFCVIFTVILVVLVYVIYLIHKLFLVILNDKYSYTHSRMERLCVQKACVLVAILK